MKNHLLIGIVSCIALCIQGQTISHSVYLIGNTHNSTSFSPLLYSLKKQLTTATQPTTCLFLGDITNTIGDSIDFSQLIFLKDIANLNKTKILITGGDRDWDDSGKKGFKNIEKLGKYIEDTLKLSKAFVPSDGCPGPKVIALDDNTVVVAINSQWFIHPFEKPVSPDTDCNILSPDDFYEELAEILDDNANKNILIMAHHPIYSSGQYAGKHMGVKHLIPIYGSFQIAFHKNIGTPKDFSFPAYRQYIEHMRKTLEGHNSILYASSHEHHNAILRENENIFIHTNASDDIKTASKNDAQLYLNNTAGYTRLDYYDNGKIIAENYYFNKGKIENDVVQILSSGCEKNLNGQAINNAVNPCAVKNTTATEGVLESISKDTTIIAGAEYAAKPFKRFWMGSQYRDEWAQPVKVPFLDLRQMGGGLKPYARGGGLQTISLKFKGKDGKKYTFRQLNKVPEKSLTEGVRKSIYKDIVKDLIASQYPYGGLVASKLMSAAGIMHAQPTLWVMPNNASLGEYRREFAGKIGTLEQKPEGKSDKQAGFGDADKIVKTNQMFRSMFKNSKNRIDKKAYAIARIFDIWVGDWDRHEDNWIWARYDTKDNHIYKPIPKDRDHVFSSWRGVIPGVADFVIPNAEHFDFRFKNMTHLTFKGTHLDRQLGTELSKEDWLDACHFIQNTMTDAVIDDAFTVLPKEIYNLKGDFIKLKLKSRRQDLINGTLKFYKILSKEVDIIGSNEREVFDIFKNKDGGLTINMYRKDKEKEDSVLVYTRTFLPSETEGVNLYGLSGKDMFNVKGAGKVNIRVRIIGGDKKDEIMDLTEGGIFQGNSVAHKPILIFDFKREDIIANRREMVLKNAADEANYNNKAFEYNALMPMPVLRQSSGNRLGIGLDFNYIKKGFNKPNFAEKYNIYALYYPKINSNRIEFNYWKRHAWGLSDLHFQQMLSTFYDKFPFYYGFGSYSTRDQELVEQGYNRTDFFTTRSRFGLERVFLRKSSFNIYALYDYNSVKPAKAISIFNVLDDKYLKGMGKTHIGGIELDFNLDFRDNPNFTKNGSLLTINNKSYIGTNTANVRDKSYLFHKAEIAWAQYQTFNIGTDLTLTGRTGFLATFGNAPFYYQTVLGSNSYLRGYTRNRFLDDYAAFYNLEARIHVGTVQTVLAPLRFGFFGFFDSGIVWGEKSYKDNRWNNAKGLGLYIAPIADVYNINFYFAKSKDKGIYSDYKIGWRF